uniref:Uncharacterized protein n=1 Tax=Tanacetum cinerariifolium TaxID=118510 RepID=A0A6L2MB68_TANCI|nr:hypothetical protein [Tanacetum cinerariifolium]
MADVAQNTKNTTIRYEKNIKFVEQPIGPALDPETADPGTINKYYESVNLEQKVTCLMLSSYAMPKELGVSLILNSLNKDYDPFFQNYNMHSMGKTLAELHDMLKLHEKGIPKKVETPAVLAIREGKIQKDNVRNTKILGKYRMELYMMNRQNGRMILESIENGPLIWPMIEENGVTRPKKYSELSNTEATQADCDVKATNIILQRLPLKVYALVNVKLVRDLHTTNIDQLHAYLGQHKFHANEVRLIHKRNSDPLALVATHQITQTYTPAASGSNSGKQRTIICYNCKREGRMSKQYTKPKRKQDDSWFKDKVLLVQAQANGQILHEEKLAFLADPGITECQATQTVITHNATSQADDLDAYDFNCDELNTLQVALIENLSYYGLDALVEAAIQNSNSSAQQDALILSVIEQLKTQVINCTKINLDNISVNDTLTGELERYKEQVKLSKEGQNVKNPFYLKKAQQLEPKLYDGDVIKNTCAIVIPDSKETLILAEESRSKMILKQQDPMILEKKNSSDPNISKRPTTGEVPKELPKVSMVNTSLKKLKHHLAGFDMVVKERTTHTAITKGSWGFKHTKACFGDEIIPFVKALKDIFNIFNQYLIDELTEVQNVFHQMEQVVEQHRLENNYVSNQSAPSFNQYSDLNELKAQSQEKDMVISKLKERIKSLCGNVNKDKVKKDIEEIETINIKLDHRVSKLIAEKEHLKQTYNQLYYSIKSTRVRSKEQSEALINQVNLKFMEISDLNTNLHEEGLIITALRNELRKLKGKAIVDNTVTTHTIDPEMLKEKVAILKEVVEQGKFLNPLNNSLDHACCPNCSLVFGLRLLQAYDQRLLSAHHFRQQIFRPNRKLIHNSIINGPYVRRMIPEPGDLNREVPVKETFHVQTDDELTENELKQIEADDQAIQTILLGLPEDIYTAVDSCETAQEIWFTSIDGESIESYYHRFVKLMNDLKRNKHFPKKIASNLKFLNNLQPEWSRHVTIVYQTKDLHTSDYTQLYDFLKYNQKKVDDLKAEQLARTQDPLALKATSNNPYTFPVIHQDQSSFNQNYMQQPMPNPKDITDLATAMNMELALMAKAFKLNYTTPTNNHQRISSNPHNRQIAQPGMNIGQDRQMVGGNDGNQFRLQDPRIQNVGNQNGLIVVPGNANQNPNGNGNLVAARAERNATGHNGNQIRCYNCKGVGHFARNYTVKPRRRDDAYLQTHLLIAQKEEARIQLQAEEFDLMAAVADLDEIEEVNANCILMANLQQASTSGTQTDKAPVYDSDGSAEVHNYENCYDNEIFNMFTQEEQYTELLEPIPEPHQVPQNDNNIISEASKTKSWLWHRRLSHLNFGTINHLARHGVVRGLSKLKIEKDHLCSAYAMGKSKKKPQKPKFEDTNQEKLYLLHMDLCGPMHVASINGKKYILIIVNDYSWFTWQNGIVERHNRALIEAARTMLIYAKTPLFLWAEAVATACYTQNRSIIRLRHGKTSYELLHDKLPDLSFFYDPLFQPMFDELLAPPPSVDHPASKFIALIADIVPPEPVASTVIYNDVKEDNHDLDLVHMNNDPFFDVKELPKTSTFRDDPLHESLHGDSTSQGSSSNMRQTHTLFESVGRWTNDHPITNVIGDPSRSVSTRKCSGSDTLHTKSREQLITGQMSFFLGLQISQSPRCIFINQSKYAYEIVKKYGMLSSDSINTPLVEKGKLDKDLQGKPVDATLYCGMIGSLLYLTSSILDLTYAGTINMGLWYSKDTGMSLTAYADADYARCQDTRRSTSGSAQFLGDKLEQMENGIVELYFVWTEYQQADIFTKPLPRERFNFLIKKLGIKSISSDTLKRLTEETDKIMDSTQAQQKALDDVLVALANRLKIGKCNLRLISTLKSKEHTLQVRSFVAIINKCLSGKTTGHDSPHLSQAYKTYYAYATGEKTLKPKYVQKKADSETSSKKSIQAPKGKRPKATAKKQDIIPQLLSQRFSDDEDDDNADNEDNDGQDDDNEQTESDSDGDDFVHPKLSTFDVLVNTNVEMPPSSVTTPPIPLVQPQHQTPVLTPAIVPNDFSKFKQTNLFAEAVSSILGIVDTYLANKMNEAIKTAIQQSDKLRDEAQAKNEDFINKLDENIKKIIKEYIKVQVKEQVSKILPRIEKLVNEQLKAKVLTRSSNEAKTSHVVAANISKLELKKILIDKIENNKSIHRSVQ